MDRTHANQRRNARAGQARARRSILIALVFALAGVGLSAFWPPAARAHAAGQAPAQPVVAGFYVNWEETSRASLRRYVDEMTHFFPEWLHISADGAGISDSRIAEDRLDIEPLVRAHHLPIIPIINNYLPISDDSDQGNWNQAAVHTLLAGPQSRTQFIGKLKDLLLKRQWQGINIDFEQVAAGDRDNLTQFMRELAAALHPAGLLVTQDVPTDDEAFDLAQLAQANDFIIPMLYDEHSAGSPDGAGSIAGIPWTKAQLAQLFARVPANKVVIALGSYAYDWEIGQTSAMPLTYQAAITQANESRDPNDASIAQIQLDPQSLNPYYRYTSSDGVPHEVWMLDATTIFNQWAVARPYTPRGVALWYLGSEDPGVWPVIGRNQLFGDSGRAIDGGALDTISYGRESHVDFEGRGELLEVIGKPADGHRALTRDSQSGMIIAETYRDYPSDYVVRRYGHLPKRIVLTFDDGPDPAWTPQILDILKREHVTATFFMIGQAVQSNPDLVARVWNEGHEIGNHTFTHANLAETSDERTRLEITATQRAIENVTGHTTTLFRPPYAIDIEPRTGDELKPILIASQWHFISVGELNDPQDWRLFSRDPDGQRTIRTAADIAESVWEDRDAGNVVLLHDGGGDRQATIEALPKIIERLKAAGYQFSTIAELRGLSREQMFPPVPVQDQALVGVAGIVFGSAHAIQRLLAFLFVLSIILGVSRQVLMAVLALIQQRRERARTYADTSDYQPLVSVVIAAYNEQQVIARTVQSILDSDYPNLEVIVVDDGSKDNTSAVLAENFAAEARVTYLRKENGGKAAALNRGLAIAKGEIIVALDADTLFMPDTIQRLVRHFADPNVGAVAGNVKVGNADNLLTKWQSLEYITSQNFDRRAYDLLNCITVVPGAVGAWRKEAIWAAGGYTHDTLAEDADLTWRIHELRWSIRNDSSALAYTEAPETLHALAKQRYRWAFGTLQNLWKHRGSLFRYGAYGWFAMPSLWLHQVLFSAIAPIMDVAIIVSLFTGNFSHVVGYYALMFGVEVLGAVLALWMDRGSWRLLPWLFFQRFLYRQLMYYVIIKSLLSAVLGGAVGWNKFERRGTARVQEPTIVAKP